MIAVNKLLVVIDAQQDSQLALDKALKIARSTDAELELLICDHNSYLEGGYYFDPPQAMQLRAEHIDKNRQMLEEMAVVIRAQGFTVSVDALWGNPPWKKIIDKVLESKADMLIQSTRHHEIMARLLLSHQDWQLIRHCPCPLLLVKDQPWHQPPVFVVAVDPTHVNDKPASLDNRLLAAGKKLAEATGGELHLFHSYYKPPVAGIYPLELDESYFREQANELLQKFAISELRLHLSAIDIQSALPQVMADIGGDVVIMGVISRSRPNRLFIGNTAEKLLDRLSQDVLVIKPEGFQS
jgi:universal stress protein E